MSQGPSVGSEVLPMEWAAGSLQKHHGCPVMHISEAPVATPTGVFAYFLADGVRWRR